MPLARRFTSLCFEPYRKLMSITATIENNIVRIPADAHFPDGAHVRIELLDQPEPGSAMREWLQTAGGAAKPGVTTAAIMRETRGEE